MLRAIKTFYSWVGLRGATPIVFALIPVVQRVPDATKIFSIAFIIVIVSMLLQGTTVAKVVRWTRMKVVEKDGSNLIASLLPPPAGLLWPVGSPYARTLNWILKSWRDCYSG